MVPEVKFYFRIERPWVYICIQKTKVKNLFSDNALGVFFGKFRYDVSGHLDTCRKGLVCIPLVYSPKSTTKNHIAPCCYTRDFTVGFAIL